MGSIRQKVMKKMILPEEALLIVCLPTSFSVTHVHVTYSNNLGLKCPPKVSVLKALSLGWCCLGTGPFREQGLGRHFRELEACPSRG